jgi:F0F1-type ATP synthase delta subunit
MKRNFARERWAEAFISVSKPEECGLKLGAAEAAFIREGLAVLQTAARIFEPRLRDSGGSGAAVKMSSELRAALQKCGYSGGHRAIETALNLFFLLIQKNYANSLALLCRTIDKRIKELSGILDVIVEFTHEPEAAFLDALKTRLIAAGNAADVEFDCRQNSELLGGYRLEIGSERLDFSVAGSLASMKKILNA